jgi:hypothetical protein
MQEVSDSGWQGYLHLLGRFTYSAGILDLLGVLPYLEQALPHAGRGFPSDRGKYHFYEGFLKVGGKLVTRKHSGRLLGYPVDSPDLGGRRGPGHGQSGSKPVKPDRV